MLLGRLSFVLPRVLLSLFTVTSLACGRSEKDSRPRPDRPGVTATSPVVGDTTRASSDPAEDHVAPRMAPRTSPRSAKTAVGRLVLDAVHFAQGRSAPTSFSDAWTRTAKSCVGLARTLAHVRSEIAEGGAVLLPSGPNIAEFEALTAFIEALPSHGIDPAPYGLDALRAAHERLARLAEAAEEHRKGPFDDQRGQALWQAALLALDDKPEAQVEAALVGAGVEESVRARLPVLQRWLADVVAARSAYTSAWAEADVADVAAVVRLIADFRLLRRTNPYRKADELAPRLQQRARDVVSWIGRARQDLPGTLAELAPKHPLYERIRASLPRYRELAASGTVKPFESSSRLKKNKHGPAVAALRERLRAEGYDPGPRGDRFDDALLAAVIAFQETHGVAAIGEVGPQTRRALNVSMADRVRQIELSLQRWRESPVRDSEGTYLRVNLPRFELQLWEGAELKRRHKVIVGSGRIIQDLKSRTIGYLNRTHLLDSAIYQVILNPYWRVPARIAYQEIGPHAERDPDYLASHGFKRTEGPGGEVLYVQKPGKQNPLGQVKFLFHNDYALYLHDTDKRWLFKETRRDFSHGCVRVQDPLELAKALVLADRGMDEAAFLKFLRMRTEYGIDLHHPIPIHLVYNSVTVDDRGRLILMEDIYRFDRAIFEGVQPVWTKRRMRSHEIEQAEARLKKSATPKP